jgi:hypothetical protein
VARDGARWDFENENEDEDEEEEDGLPELGER